MLAAGGTAAELDWLLELGGGLAWRQLQELRLWPERPVLLLQPLGRLEQLWLRHRGTAEPLQYLVGRCPWRDLDLAVAPGVLIPRQETELLVDLALELAPAGPAAAFDWADLGTGSGCLAIALALALPAARGFAVEASGEALEQAAANLARAGIGDRCTLLRSDWWTALEPWWGSLELVVSNPPYIAEDDGHLPALRHEPQSALVSGRDGLDDLRKIIGQATTRLVPGGWLLLEHGHDQSASVQTLLQAAGWTEVGSRQDLAGIVRCTGARLPSPMNSKPLSQGR
jgi:release factor glutamine methyltransferase